MRDSAGKCGLNSYGCPFLIFFKYSIQMLDRLCALATIKPAIFPLQPNTASRESTETLEGMVGSVQRGVSTRVRQLLQALGAVCVKPSSRQWFAFPTIPFALTLALRVIWKSALQRMQRIESTGWSISSRATFC